MCAYELRDGKIERIRTVYDRLSLLQQASTGWLQSKIVNAVASQTEVGLNEQGCYELPREMTLTTHAQVS